MLWIHPVLQALVTLVAFYVLFLGVQRFRRAHLGHKVPFAWKRHVFLGRSVIIGWILGLVLGKAAVYYELGMMEMFQVHSQWSMIMTVFMLVSYATGSALDRRPKKRVALPLIHACSGAVLLGIALYQAYTGWLIIDNFILR